MGLDDRRSAWLSLDSNRHFGFVFFPEVEGDRRTSVATNHRAGQFLGFVDVPEGGV